MNPIKINIRQFLLHSMISILIVITMVIAIILYQFIYKIIISGFESKLVGVASITGAWIDGDQHEKIWNLYTQDHINPIVIEEKEIYLQYVKPMQTLKQELNLAYLYTQMIKQDSLFYILDANTDDDHTLVGSEDELPDLLKKEQANILEKGQMLISPIQKWEQWGLIKSVWVPIYSQQQQHFVAMTGADVNISSIREKTRFALFAVVGVGLLSLLLVIIVTFLIIEKLSSPIDQMKYMALSVAAGNFGQQVKIEKPEELAELANTFNYMSEAISKSLTSLTETNAIIEQKRYQEEITLLLNKNHEILR